MTMSRRDLLVRTAAGAGIVAVGNVSTLLQSSPFAAGALGAAPIDYGPLVDDPAGLLDLPAGFSYTVVSQVNDLLPRGGIVPDAFDGTAVFSPEGSKGYRLVRNHEQGGSAAVPTVATPGLTYDPAATGGTSTLELDADGNRVDEYVSLAGTLTNCAGGLTPWGTWLTCEETETKIGGAITKDHGYVFEVDPLNLYNNLDPTPLTAMGRFAHEAVAVDPKTGVVYETEDAGNPNGLVYRFVPNNPLGGYGSLRDGGTLTAMRCAKKGVFVPDLSVIEVPGTALDVSWVPVADPSALVQGSIRKQFDYAGGPASTPGGPITRSRKFEGAWWGNGKAYIVCSFARFSDGSAGQHDGQVWSYNPVSKKLRLEVRFALNPDETSDLPDGPDNITVSPFGGFFLAEDGSGVQHLIAVDSAGVAKPFARNARDDSEFTGVCFSADRKILFANLQSPGTTFAIKGPFGG